MDISKLSGKRDSNVENAINASLRKLCAKAEKPLLKPLFVAPFGGSEGEFICVFEPEVIFLIGFSRNEVTGMLFVRSADQCAQMLFDMSYDVAAFYEWWARLDPYRVETDLKLGITHDSILRGLKKEA